MESIRTGSRQAGDRLLLPSVTLCAAASVNVTATVEALRFSLDRVNVADCLLFTDKAVAQVDERIRVVPIAPMTSAAHYSSFLLRHLVEHLRTEHCLIVQWDGFVLEPDRWDPQFLRFDYVGAVWPQFSDGRSVGNGGFSLRSRKLLEACRDPMFRVSHPEDVAICRENRSMLEDRKGIRFADPSTAERFSFERARPRERTFGFHGIFNMIPLLGQDRFWEIYRTLDDRTSAHYDFWLLIKQLGRKSKATGRRLQLTRDLVTTYAQGIFGHGPPS